MKRIESVKLSGINGERVDVVTFARWKKKIAGLEFSFALHLLPSFKVGLPNKLWISEIGTGFNTLVVVKHPVSGQHMTDVAAEKFSHGFVVKLAKSALHNQLKACGDSAFVDGLVRAEILLAKQQRQLQLDRELDHAAQVNCEACEDTGVTATLGDGGELKAVECQVCLDSKVVATTDVDHEGNNVEARCPECVEQNGGLSQPAYANVSTEYAGDLLHPDTVLTEADLPSLRHQRDQLQLQIDQHGTMTGDTTNQDYEDLTGELAELDNKIYELENPPCSK